MKRKILILALAARVGSIGKLASLSEPFKMITFDLKLLIYVDFEVSKRTEIEKIKMIKL